MVLSRLRRPVTSRAANPSLLRARCLSSSAGAASRSSFRNSGEQSSFKEWSGSLLRSNPSFYFCEKSSQDVFRGVSVARPASFSTVAGVNDSLLRLKGLMTPIVRNADQKSISSISSEVKQLAEKARTGKLAPNRNFQQVLYLPPCTPTSAISGDSFCDNLRSLTLGLPKSSHGRRFSFGE